MTRTLIGAALVALAMLPGGAAQAGQVADRCLADGGGSASACSCVEREIAASASARLAPIVQAFIAGRADEARAMVQDLSVAERGTLQETLPRALPDANIRCSTVWQPRS